MGTFISRSKVIGYIWFQKTIKNTTTQTWEAGRLIRNRWKLTLFMRFYLNFWTVYRIHSPVTTIFCQKNTKTPLLYTIIKVRSPASGPGDGRSTGVHLRTRASYWSICLLCSPLSPSLTPFLPSFLSVPLSRPSAACDLEIWNKKMQIVTKSLKFSFIVIRNWVKFKKLDGFLCNYLELHIILFSRDLSPEGCGWRRKARPWGCSAGDRQVVGAAKSSPSCKYALPFLNPSISLLFPSEIGYVFEIPLLLCSQNHSYLSIVRWMIDIFDVLTIITKLRYISIRMSLFCMLMLWNWINWQVISLIVYVYDWYFVIDIARSLLMLLMIGCGIFICYWVHL